MSSKATRECRQQHHEKQWVRWFLKIEALRRKQGRREFDSKNPEAVIPMRWKLKRKRAAERSYRLVADRDAPALCPAYGLCPKTGTWHKLTTWDMALGCDDCGWNDWGESKLADGRELSTCVCIGCRDRSGFPLGLNDWPVLRWTPRLAGRLLRHPEAQEHIEALAAYRARPLLTDAELETA